MINYRLAQHEDFDDLVKLMSLSSLGLQAEDYSENQIRGALGTVFGVDSQLIDDGTYFVARSRNSTIACGGWSRRETLFGGDANKNNEPDPELDPKVDAARIRAFFVHPDHARRGIGMELIHRCEEAARKHGFKRMELVATLAGQRLYAKAGYKALNHFDINLINGEKMPAVSMARNLDFG